MPKVIQPQTIKNVELLMNTIHFKSPEEGLTIKELNKLTDIPYQTIYRITRITCKLLFQYSRNNPEKLILTGLLPKAFVVRFPDKSVLKKNKNVNVKGEGSTDRVKPIPYHYLKSVEDRFTKEIVEALSAWSPENPGTKDKTYWHMINLARQFNLLAEMYISTDPVTVAQDRIKCKPGEDFKDYRGLKLMIGEK